MSADAGTPDSGYVNWPPPSTQTARRLGLGGSAGRRATGRAMDRVRLTLRAYEQREERRAALYAWMAARAMVSGQTS